MVRDFVESARQNTSIFFANLVPRPIIAAEFHQTQRSLSPTRTLSSSFCPVFSITITNMNTSMSSSFVLRHFYRLLPVRRSDGLAVASS